MAKRKQRVPVGYACDLAGLRDDHTKLGTLETSRVFLAFFNKYLDYYTSVGFQILRVWQETGYTANDMAMIGMARVATAVVGWKPGMISKSRNKLHRGKPVTLVRFVRWHVGNAMQLKCREALRWPSTNKDTGTSRMAKALVYTEYATTAGIADYGDAVRVQSSDMACMAQLSTTAAMSGTFGGKFSLGMGSSAWMAHIPDMTLRMRDACTIDDPLDGKLRQHVLECLAQDMTITDALESADLTQFNIRDVEHGLKLVTNWSGRLRTRNSSVGAR